VSRVLDGVVRSTVFAGDEPKRQESVEAWRVCIAPIERCEERFGDAIDLDNAMMEVVELPYEIASEPKECITVGR
jgi:hypothetical protein